MFLLLVPIGLILTISADAEAQLYLASPYASTYQPAVQTVPAVPPYTATVYSQPAAQTVPAVPSYTPTVYSADPGFFSQIQPGSGNYMPDLFGWDRGSEHFNKWLKVPIHHKNNVRWRIDGQKMSNGFNSASGADPNKFTDKYSNPGSYQGRRKRDAEADPQYFATPYVIPVASPEVAYTVPNVASAPRVVNTPTVAYAPTMYIANPTANPDPMFFGMGGMYGNRGGSYLNNNIGGKADYGNYGDRYYPTYGDYYRTHRYPLNDGWMNWDEDLRDKDTAKADKFGSGKKDGGR